METYLIVAEGKGGGDITTRWPLVDESPTTLPASRAAEPGAGRPVLHAAGNPVVDARQPQWGVPHQRGAHCVGQGVLIPSRGAQTFSTSGFICVLHFFYNVNGVLSREFPNLNSSHDRARNLGILGLFECFCPMVNFLSFSQGKMCYSFFTFRKRKGERGQWITSSTPLLNGCAQIPCWGKCVSHRRRFQVIAGCTAVAAVGVFAIPTGVLGARQGGGGRSSLDDGVAIPNICLNPCKGVAPADETFDPEWRCVWRLVTHRLPPAGLKDMFSEKRAEAAVEEAQAGVPICAKDVWAPIPNRGLRRHTVGTVQPK